ncbi:MAG TPA: TlpA disulfide reductase family protein [Candidatus Polarisedimenticolia bacterium]|nr:TlpA disulfide reductase family protein [Candidatus Polarisedimenticolia bacterium]
MTASRAGISWIAAVPLVLSLASGLSTGQTAPPPPTPPAAPAAPAPAAPAPAAPAPPPNPVNFIRNKIAAGDLLSAESILEVMRADNGEDATWLSGLSWVARGALLLGDEAKAKRYAGDVRSHVTAAKALGAKLEDDHALELAWGTAIEVEAQLLERRSGSRKAAEFLRGELAKTPGPVALRSRLNKRLNMMTLAGTAAPELVVEDFAGDARPPALAALQGKPVVLFLWAEWCGDCKGMARALAHARKTHSGVAFVGLTRYYDAGDERAAEKARVEDVWKTVYADVGAMPMVISTASMERYGGSSTPTFVFIDRTGIVRRYTPTRLTEEALDQAIATIVG